MAILSTNELLGTTFEPIQKSRFQMLVDGISPFQIKAVTLPEPSTSKITIDQANTQTKVAGKTTWSDMTMVLYNSIAPSVMQAIYDWQRLKIEYATGRAGYSDFYKKNMTFQILDPVGSVIQQWKVNGAFILTITGNEFDKSADDKVDITVTLSADSAFLEF